MIVMMQLFIKKLRSSTVFFFLLQPFAYVFRLKKEYVIVKCVQFVLCVVEDDEAQPEWSQSVAKREKGQSYCCIGL